MKKLSVSALLTLLAAGVSLLYAQEQAAPPQAGLAVPEYRVMHLGEMFKGDEEAMKKIGELSVRVTGGTNQVQVNRTDMDSKDYERALNRLAKEGWTLVTVNKSNYWVFVKTPR